MDGILRNSQLFATEMHVAMERKPASLYGEAFKPERLIELNAAEWNDLLANPQKDRPWLEDVKTCLVYGPSNAGTIAINTEGYAHARYAARIA